MADRTFKKLIRNKNAEPKTSNFARKASFDITPAYRNYKFDKYSCQPTESAMNETESSHATESSKVEKLVCADCLNRNIAENKRRRRERKVEVYGNFGNNYEDEMLIQDKIRKREQLTGMAAREVDNFVPKEKEELQRINEDDNFFANSTDYLKLRAKKKEQQLDQFVNKNYNCYLPQEKDSVNRYFEKYVGEGNESLIKPRPCPYDKKEYYENLRRQADNTRKLKNAKDNEQMNADKELMASQMDKLNREYSDKYNMQKMNQRNMDDTNRRLIKLKEKRRKDELLKDKDEERNILEGIRRKNEMADELSEQKRERICKMYNDNYNVYLRHRQNEKDNEYREKVEERKLKGMCFHGCDMANCEICHRPVPVRTLTYLKVPKNKKQKNLHKKDFS